MRSLPLQILSAMLFGIALGLLFGPAVEPIGILGKLVIQLIKALALPLAFVAIIEAAVSTSLSMRSARQLVTVATTNAILAATIGLLLTGLIQPGSSLTLSGISACNTKTASTGPFQVTDKTLAPMEMISGYIPSSILSPFIESNMISAVILALLVGLSARKTIQFRFPEFDHPVQQTLRFALATFEQVFRVLVHLVPLAVLGVTAKTVGEHGLAPFVGLAWYVAVGIAGMIIHVVLIYGTWICLIVKLPLKTFLTAAKDPVIHAFGTNSSLATLPLTLKSLDSLGVSRSASRLGACIGTNLNNDGIILYEAMAVIFVCQACGIDLTVMAQLKIIGLAMIAAIGVAGVPEAGLISLALVLSTAGLPIEMLPLLLTVDWVVARARSVTNVLSDMTVSIVLNHQELSQPHSN